MEQKNFITSWQEAHAIIDEAMTKGDRSVSIYISPDGGMSISVYPWPDEESLRTAYEQGKISYNDYRAKLGLPMIKNNENHFFNPPKVKSYGFGVATPTEPCAM